MLTIEVKITNWADSSAWQSANSPLSIVLLPTPIQTTKLYKRNIKDM